MIEKIRQKGKVHMKILVVNDDSINAAGIALLAKEAGICYRREHDLTPEDLICQLDRKEQKLFHFLYAGKLAKSIYRLYEFDTKNEPA